MSQTLRQKTIEPTETAVDCRGVSKTFQSRFSSARVDALREIDLQVPHQAVFGFLGPNGAGKTTLIKILLGVLRPTAGEARLLGVPVSSVSARIPIGYLPENHRFPEFMSGEDLLRFGARLAGVPKVERESRIQTLMKLVGMEEWSKVKIKKYSKGMTQRVGLAQAMVNRPRLVFLDEPTDGVDPIGRVAIRDILLRMRDEGVTIFLNSHLLSEVERVCDGVAILNQGEVVFNGSLDELTMPRAEYEIALHEPTESGMRALKEKFPGRFDPRASNVIRAPDRSEANRLIDAARAAGQEIESVVCARATLEEAFIDLLEDAGSHGEVPSPGKAGGRRRRGEVS